MSRPVSHANALWHPHAPSGCPSPRPYFRSPPVEAGFASPAADYVEESLDLQSYLILNPPATFFVRLRGRSMVDAGLLDNDVVVVDRSIPGRVNGIVVAVWQGGLVVKRLRWVDKRLALVAENRLETYPALYLDEDPDHVIWGTAIGAARKL